MGKYVKFSFTFTTHSLFCITIIEDDSFYEVMESCAGYFQGPHGGEIYFWVKE